MAEFTGQAPLDGLPEVRLQYERYPYPPRDPAEEARQLITTELDFLDHLNHYGYAGCARFDDGFRVLVAGGGTGDAAIFLGEQLRGRNAEVVYLDLSATSLAIARDRADVRRLTNIRFVRGSLLDLAHSDLGRFDYINCCGVLHHLPDPDAGLAALISVLGDRGVLGLMLYGRIGRLAIYQVQDLLRLTHSGRELSADERIADARALLESLAPEHWFMRAHRKAADPLTTSDAELYDLLLHAQDCSYTIADIYAMLARQALVLRTFVAFPGRARRMFSPRTYTRNPALLARVEALPTPELQAWCELMHANMRKHSFYVSREALALPDVDNLEMVPSFSMCFARADGDGIYRRFADAVSTSRGAEFVLEADGARVQFPRTPTMIALFRHLDGRRTLREILTRVHDDLAVMGPSAPSLDVVSGEWRRVFGILNYNDWLLLRHRDVEPLPSMHLMQQRIGGGVVSPA